MGTSCSAPPSRKNDWKQSSIKKYQPKNETTNEIFTEPNKIKIEKPNILKKQNSTSSIKIVFKKDDIQKNPPKKEITNESLTKPKKIENPIILKEVNPRLKIKNECHEKNLISLEKKEKIIDIDQFAKLLLKILIMSNDQHYGITCDVCNKSNFKGNRYKCLSCKDYDLCDMCFEKKKVSLKHLISHPMLLIQDPDFKRHLEILVITGLNKIDEICKEKGIIHTGIRCDGCDLQDIQGIRFNCDQCLDYDLCINCLNGKKVTKDHSNQHPVIAMMKPKVYKIPFNQIKLGDKLGEGSFGKTYKAEWKNQTIACKMLDFNLFRIQQKSDSEKQKLMHQIQSFKNESKIYRELCCPNIIRFYGESENRKIQLNTIGDVDLGLSFCLCLEFMENGTLWDALYRDKKEFSLRKKFNLCLNLISGLRRIHSKNIVHKDLKPDNLFLNKDNELKIGDLGLGYHEILANDLKNIKQMIYYPISENSSKAGDIFSCGLIINEIFTGEVHARTLLGQKIINKSSYFYDVIEKCVKNNQFERPTAEQIEEYFLKFDDFFWKYIKEKKVIYLRSMNNLEKDKVFRQIYKSFIQNNIGF